MAQVPGHNSAGSGYYGASGGERRMADNDQAAGDSKDTGGEPSVEKPPKGLHFSRF
jgi:hypothetical protein